MSYAAVTEHRSMAFDVRRNRFYEAAIRRVVKPDSVVLDLGAGLGVHGLMAAAAGARRVFLVDPEIAVQSAMEVARLNGFGDRVEAFQSRIESTELPEKVDVIISVLVGNLLYSEDLLPSLYHARDHWLKPGGQLIPDRAELMLAPVHAAKLHDEEVKSWSTPQHGFDYSALRRYAANSVYSLRDYRDQTTLLAPASAVFTADLQTDTSTNLEAKARFRAETASVCSGLAAWVRMRIGEDWLATGPKDPEVHWGAELLAIDPELRVQPEEELAATLQRPRGGDWTSTLSQGEDARRGSSFLSQPQLASRLMALSPDYQPKLNESGRARLFVLEQFDKGRANRQIAESLHSAFPSQFSDAGEALSLVRHMAQSHGI